MNTLRPPFKQTEIPTNLHTPDESGHYVPHKARDPQQIAERRAQRPGTLTARNEAYGVALSRVILDHTTTVEGRRFTAKLIALSGINSAHYLGRSFAADDHVRRRNHKAPIIAEDDWRQTTAGQKTETITSLGVAATAAEYRANAIADGRPYKRATAATRRAIATAAFNAALLQEERIPVFGTVFDAQEWSRDTTTDAVREARDFAKQTGSILSMAQFADQRSPIYTIWEDAPDDAYQALTIARTQLPLNS